MDRIVLEEKISALFHGGEKTVRQVRLAEDEADYVSLHYLAEVRDLSKNWYEITFTGRQH
ncbi:MAG: hypothetical protein RSB55_02620 [Oscillospiraceae bacterium]